MKASNIPKHENSFFINKKDSLGKKFIVEDKKLSFNNEIEKMPYVLCKRVNNDDSFYYREKHIKNQIVIHYTVGYLKGDIATLTTPDNHVSVPFILGRNGKILNMWYSAYWSYHLGPGAVGGNTAGSKRTIGIEISNIGFLKEIGNNLVSIYSDNDIYCSKDETTYYQKLDNPFRGQKYYATFTNKQYESLIVLLRYLTEKYNIPREFVSEDKRFESGDNTIVNFKGIVSHVNYRTTGKWDIGPAFDWDRIIRGVKA